MKTCQNPHPNTRPAIPAEELAGKTGIVLLGENVALDEVLMLDGEPEPWENRLILPLADTRELRLNQLFSDGHIAARPVLDRPDPAENLSGLPALPRGANRRMLASAGLPLTAQSRGIDDTISDLTTFSVESTNWSGTVKNFKPSDFAIDFDVDVWKLRFNLAVTIGYKADFDIQTTGAANEVKEVVSGALPLGYGFSLKLTYSIVADFCDTP